MHTTHTLLSTHIFTSVQMLTVFHRSKTPLDNVVFNRLPEDRNNVVHCSSIYYRRARRREAQRGRDGVEDLEEEGEKEDEEKTMGRVMASEK